MTGGVELARRRASKPSTYVGSNWPDSLPVIMNSRREVLGFILSLISPPTLKIDTISGYRMEELEEMKKMR